MIEHELDRTHAILHVRPEGVLEKGDFQKLAETVDPYIETTGSIAGLLIEAPQFPGWDSLGAMAEHFRFVLDHHRKIQRIALVTDSVMGQVAERLAAHFVAAEIRQFSPGEMEAARRWLLQGAAVE